MSKSQSRTRRTFTRVYKLQAVQLVTENGYSYVEVARQLGITDAQIRNWKKHSDAAGTQAFPGRGNPVDEEVQGISD